MTTQTISSGDLKIGQVVNVRYCGFSGWEIAPMTLIGLEGSVSSIGTHLMDDEILVLNNEGEAIIMRDMIVSAEAM